MSLNKNLLVELSPYSLQIAVLAGERLIACRDFSPEAKDAITGFVSEHQGAPVSLALLAPKSQFARLSSEEEAASIRTSADLLTFAAKTGNTFGASAAAIACDATTGLAPSADQSSNWVLAGAQASVIEAATEQLSALGLAPQAVSFALPAQLGAAVAALKNTPDSRVALWQLNETDSQLWLVSASGVEKTHSLAIGFNHIFDAVQAELGLKFRTAAAKLFLNNAYEFGDLAGNIAGRLRDQLLIGLAALGTKPSALGLLNLPVHQAWFARGVAQSVDLPLWSVDVSALCTQLGVEGEAVTSQLPACTLGLLKAAGSAGKTGIAWVPPLLGEQPTASGVPAQTAAAKPATPAPASPASAPASPASAPASPASAPASPASAPASPAPAAATTPAPARAAAPASSTPAAAVPAAQPAATRPSPVPAATPAPAPAAPAQQNVPVQPKPKKSPLVLVAVGGLVVAGIAVAAVSMVMKNKTTGDAPAKPSVQPPVQAQAKEVPVPVSTVAYYRFDEGAPDETLGYATDGIVPDFAKKGGDFQVKAGKPTYNANVPFANVDGRSNILSAQFHTGDNVELTSQADLNNTVFQDFTVEAFVKFDDLKGWQTFIGRDAGDPADTDKNFALFYLQKTPDTALRPNDPLLNVFRVAVVTTERRTCEVKSSFAAQQGTWYHVAAVGNSKEGTLTLYVDGKNVGQTQGYTGLMKPKSSSPWTIGRGQFNRKPMDPVTGCIDEVRFSNAALKPEQFLKATGK